MPCFYPLDAWRPNNGVKKLLFSYNSKYCGSVSPDLQIPCGQCVGCRLERSRQWAVRCMHEAKMHERNCFITLTYSDAALASDDKYRDRGLHYEDFQLFMKRLRKSLVMVLGFICVVSMVKS